MGGSQRGASILYALSTRSGFCLHLVSVQRSRRIRSQARSSNNSNHASPRLVSYFSKVFKQASAQKVTELHDGKDQGRRTMLCLPLSMRRNNRDHRQKMGPLRTSPSRKRWNTPLQQASPKTSGNNCEDSEKGSEGASANRAS